MEGADNEDMFVVIIEDKEEESSVDNTDKIENNQDINIKQEVIDDEIVVEELLETAEKYGEPVKLEYLQEDDDEVEYIDENYEDPIYIEDDFSDEDFDDGSGDEKRQIRFNPTVAYNREQHRHKMLPPDQQQSFVKQLRQDYPELKKDTELLIDTLAHIMVDIKRPDPPQDYYRVNDDDIMLECVECGALSETLPAASRHWQEKHGPRYLTCLACGVDFRSTTNLYKHEKRCTSRDAEIVLKARARTLGRKGRGRPFLVSKDSLRKLKNQQQAKKKIRFRCSFCPADFASKQAVQSHEYKHTGQRPYRCHLCPAAYTSASGLSRHSIKHTDIQYICDKCQRPFKNKSALIVHLDSHNHLRKYACAECGRRFAQKMGLNLHIDRDHLNLPPPCACQICPRRFPRMSLLKTHMLKEHGMTLITQKMFYKSLPMLSETQLQQAKVVLKSDLQKPVIEPPQTDNETEVIEEAAEEEESSTSENLLDEVMQHIKKLRKDQNCADSKYIVIQNGEAICVDGDQIGFYKNNLISEVEYELDQQLEYNVVEVEEDSKADVLKKIEELAKLQLEGMDEGNQLELESAEHELCEISGMVVRQRDDTEQSDA
ncbi:zinc finger protein 26-like [Phthorimaea operculella]|nr:zinc finger protein 26-like [Phthorimaea operculella]